MKQDIAASVAVEIKDAHAHTESEFEAWVPAEGGRSLCLDIFGCGHAHGHKVFNVSSVFVSNRLMVVLLGMLLIAFLVLFLMSPFLLYHVVAEIARVAT